MGGGAGFYEWTTAPTPTPTRQPVLSLTRRSEKAARPHKHTTHNIRRAIAAGHHFPISLSASAFSRVFSARSLSISTRVSAAASGLLPTTIGVMTPPCSSTAVTSTSAAPPSHQLPSHQLRVGGEGRHLVAKHIRTNEVTKTVANPKRRR